MAFNSLYCLYYGGRTSSECVVVRKTLGDGSSRYHYPMNDKIPPCTNSSDPVTADRYARLDLEADATVIYDREQTNAWIQSDVLVPTEISTASITGSESKAQRERELAAENAERPGNRSDID